MGGPRTCIILYDFFSYADGMAHSFTIPDLSGRSKAGLRSCCDSCLHRFVGGDNLLERITEK